MMLGVEVSIVLQLENINVTPHIERLWVITVLCYCSISQTVYILGIWSRRPCQYIAMPTGLLSYLIWVSALHSRPTLVISWHAYTIDTSETSLECRPNTFTSILQYFCLQFIWRTRLLSWINKNLELFVECPSAELHDHHFAMQLALKC